ncbi:MAG: hypothetical protein ACK5XN_23715, partial [Bacteroidota bacterium]
ACLTNGEIQDFANNLLSNLSIVCDYLTSLGVELIGNKDLIIVNGKNNYFTKKIEISTNTFPGFATDLQPIFLPLMCQRAEMGILNEIIFDSRFKHINELIKMGAKIRNKDSNKVFTKKIKSFLPSDKLISYDIRGGASILLAALNAKGQSKIFNFTQIQRGYDNLIPNLCNLGADIEISNE